mgnify:CR=1 FL=1
MTKKHFTVIAETIKSALVNESGDRDTLEGLALQFVGRFSAINPLFNADKFMKACGFTE